jgi:hypothetical protein
MKIYNEEYYGNQLNFYIFPSSWMTKESLLILHNDLKYVNQNSKCPLDYGILANDITYDEIKSFFENVIVCIIKKDKEKICFFYTLRLEKKPIQVLHLGLVVINKNPGTDLFNFSYATVSRLIYKVQGETYVTNITASPTSVGLFTELYSEPWPTHKSNLIKPPSKKYLKIATICFEKYIRVYFKDKDSVKFNKKRFIIESDISENGFITDYHSLARHKNVLVNLFCLSWINYSKGTEDVFQVGRLGLSSYLWCTLCVYRSKISEKFNSVKSFLGKKDD